MDLWKNPFPRSKTLAELPYNLISMTAFLIAWQIVSLGVYYVRGVPFPAPVETFLRLFSLLGGGKLYGVSIYGHLSNSLVRWTVGFSLAAVVGLLLGIAVGYFHVLSEIIMPSIHVLQLIPGLAWIPITLLLFGLGDTAAVFMIFVTAFTPIVINTAGGTRSIDRKYIRAAKMMGARDATIFFRIILPGALLQIINGLRIGLANGWRVLVAAEMIVGVASGLGYSIIQSRWSLDFEAAFVCLILICMIGLIVEKLIFGMIERKTMERLGLREGE